MGREADMQIRKETARDCPAISSLIAEAFLSAEHSTGREADIVIGLRTAGALVLSLVAEEEGRILGHIAISQAKVGGEAGWFLVGPLAVLPAWQGRGIGSALMRAAIEELKGAGSGFVLVGYPDYYGRFGFRSFARLTVAGVPAENVMALPFGSAEPVGEIVHHPAFGLDQA
ncbi:N-acetyltransferase [Breoghania sp. JC706]|uniref:GNAT family N-acetyltransferase n=1 Tax=Breoghania sp. JC706 TaxID=3117732 RepID=UPI00300A2E77